MNPSTHEIICGYSQYLHGFTVLLYLYTICSYAVTRCCGSGGCVHRQQCCISILELKDVENMIHRATPDKATTILLCITVKPIVGIILEI